MKIKSNQYNSGFTLIELSIVIVIIGLIIAAIIAGQTLVAQARLRTLISEQENIKKALNAFRLQHNALPGDMDNAFTYWPSCGADADECNGDGNRQITITGSDEDLVEGYRFWQHLALSSIYPGSFTGEGAGSGAQVLEGNTGVNIPMSKFKKAGITPIYESAGDQTATGTNHTGNILIFGGYVLGVTGSPDPQDDNTGIAKDTIFTTVESYIIDQKVDDSVPLTGTVLAIGAVGDFAHTCVTATAYNLDATNTSPCALAFTLDKTK